MAEVFALLPKLSPKYQALVCLGVTTGCRISELLVLRRSDLLWPSGDLKESVFFIQLKARKNKKRRIHLPESVRPWIIRFLKIQQNAGYERPDDLVFRGKCGKSLSRLTVYCFFRNLIGRRHGTHWMRKTFAQESYKRYFDEYHDGLRAAKAVQHLLGHARLATTLKYLGFEEDKEKEVQDAVFQFPAPPGA